jgi:hypothetical protein
MKKGILEYLTHQTKRKEKEIKFRLENKGHCPTCDSDVTFIADNEWLRDHYMCTNCGSIPRERALMHVIDTFFPNWRDLVIHESSPSNRGASARLSTNCKHYVPLQIFPNTPLGSMIDGTRCENLEEMTFENESIDLHVTQDVMEHVFHPSRVWKEMARTLKLNGAHVFTVPLVNKTKPSNLRAKMNQNGEIIHILPPIYHGNPISNEGSLMTVEWGFDICKHIFDSSGLFTYMIYLDDINKGIRAEYIEVLITFKSKPTNITSNYSIP